MKSRITIIGPDVKSILSLYDDDMPVTEVGKDLDVMGRHSFPTFFLVLKFHPKSIQNQIGNNLRTSVVIANHH